MRDKSILSWRYIRRLNVWWLWVGSNTLLIACAILKAINLIGLHIRVVQNQEVVIERKSRNQKVRPILPKSPIIPLNFIGEDLFSTSELIDQTKPFNMNPVEIGQHVTPNLWGRLLRLGLDKSSLSILVEESPAKGIVSSDFCHNQIVEN